MFFFDLLYIQNERCDLRFFYCAESKQFNGISKKGIRANMNGQIPIVLIDERFLMYQFVINSYAYEILGLEEYCYFEIAPKGVRGEIIEMNSTDILSPFYKLLKQDTIEPEFLSPQLTDRYKSMGFDIGAFLVENKENFTDTYKKKILDYAKESMK